MGLAMTCVDYVDYLVQAGKRIASQKEYITALDSKTGDGDHWVNLNMGFEKLSAMQAELQSLKLAPMLQKVGMTMMSVVGGSSGALYGSAYIAAAKVAEGRDVIDVLLLCALLDSMQKAIMQRGRAEPGFKTMLDSLHVAVTRMQKAVDSGQDDVTALTAMKNGAKDGMESTKDMEAVKGRASYQTNKGVGELDPGAVTMCMQLECLADLAILKIA